jgi:RNA polymerase-interacting CarD/CdnL/TRCF family regulator
MRRIYLSLLVLVTLLVSACGLQRAAETQMVKDAAAPPPAPTAMATRAAVGAEAAPPPAPTAMAARAAVGAEAAPGSGGETYRATEGYDTVPALPDGAESQPEHVVVYTGSIALVVKDAGQAATDITALATRLGGYVSGANLYMQKDVQRGSLTIRVPAEKYQEALTALRAMAVRVETETTGTEDVTQEYTDLQARKANLEHTEQALQKLLDERLQVGRTQDILEVYRELSNVRGQIEQIEGRLRYLANLAAMSTITIELIPDVLYQPVAVAGWEPQGIARQALQSLVSALQVLGTVLIWVTIFVLPILVVVLLPLALLILLIRWLVRRRRGKKSA